MTIKEHTICSLMQTFPVLLILAQKHSKCLETPFIYKPPSPTHSPEYYEALEALFSSIYGSHAPPEHTHSPSYPSNCYGSYGQYAYYYGKKSYDYGHGKPCYTPSVPSVTYYQSGTYPQYSKKGMYSNNNMSYGSGFSGYGGDYGSYSGGAQVNHVNNRYKVVVKKTKIGRRKKTQKLQKLELIDEGFLVNKPGFFPNRDRGDRRFRDIINPQNVRLQLSQLLHLRPQSVNRNPANGFNQNVNQNGFQTNQQKPQNQNQNYDGYIIISEGNDGNIDVIKIDEPKNGALQIPGVNLSTNNNAQSGNQNVNFNRPINNGNIFNPYANENGNPNVNFNRPVNDNDNVTPFNPYANDNSNSNVNFNIPDPSPNANQNGNTNVNFNNPFNNGNISPFNPPVDNTNSINNNPFISGNISPFNPPDNANVNNPVNNIPANPPTDSKPVNFGNEDVIDVPNDAVDFDDKLKPVELTTLASSTTLSPSTTVLPLPTLPPLTPIPATGPAFTTLSPLTPLPVSAPGFGDTSMTFGSRDSFNFMSNPTHESCVTVDDNVGNCVSVYECEPFISLLQQGNPGAPQLLRRAHCGFEGDNPKVCCPRKPIPTVPPPTAPIPTNPPVTPIPIPADPPSEPDREGKGNSEYTTLLPEPPVCGISNASFGRVVGGVAAKLGDFPWMALLGYNSRTGPRWLCGGSLFTSRHVLTAAHCIYGHENDLFQVRLGELDLAREDDGATPTDVPIAQKIMHEEYDRKAFTNDIGILVLEKTVKFTDLIRPICIPFNAQLRSTTFENYTPLVAGWGNTEFRGPSATHLQTVQLPVVSNAFCKEAYASYKSQQIDERVLCAGYRRGGKDACQGDSGGPLTQPIWTNSKTYFYQIGVVSFGKKCGEPGFPGVYTRVTSFIPWIQKKLAETS